MRSRAALVKCCGIKKRSLLGFQSGLQLVPCFDHLRAESISAGFEGFAVVLHQALLHTPVGCGLCIVVVRVNVGVQRCACRLRAVGAVPQGFGQLDAVLRDKAVQVVQLHMSAHKVGGGAQQCTGHNAACTAATAAAAVHGYSAALDIDDALFCHTAFKYDSITDIYGAALDSIKNIHSRVYTIAGKCERTLQIQSSIGTGHIKNRIVIL